MAAGRLGAGSPRSGAHQGDVPGYEQLLEERYSWEVMEQVHEDVLMVAQRLLDFYQGGPRPTYEDFEFVDALERMQEREANGLVSCKRRSVNVALRKLRKEPKCTSASQWGIGGGFGGDQRDLLVPDGAKGRPPADRPGAPSARRNAITRSQFSRFLARVLVA